MAIYISDKATVQLGAKLSKQAAVRLAVAVALKRAEEATSLRDQIAAWRAQHPVPPSSGSDADKAFFDDLSGDL